MLLLQLLQQTRTRSNRLSGLPRHRSSAMNNIW